MKTLKLIFKSLVNNGAVMEGRFQPWYVALLLFFVSVIFATYPTFSQINAREGSVFLSGTTYSVENAFTIFSETLKEEDIQLVVKTNEVDGVLRYELINEGTPWETVFTTAYPGSEFTYFEYSVNNVPRIRIYYQASQSDETTGAFVNQLLALPKGDTTLTSFMMLTKHAVRVYLYNPLALANAAVSGEEFVASFNGTYDAVPINTNLSFSADASNRTPDVGTYVTRVFGEWKGFFDQSFAYSKGILLWAQTLLTFVVNMIMALLMSIVIFIMTRGKMNPNKGMKFGETMKIGAWALFSPALLTIVAGALFPEFSATAFVLFVGLRLMWLSSKYLRPVDVIANTPTKK